MAEASDFKFGTHFGFAKPIIKSHKEEKWTWPWARAPSQNFAISFNICATARASNFKFSMYLEFAQAHHKTTPRGKVAVALGYGRSQIFGVPL